MNILRNNSKMDPNLQAELADYGLARYTAEQNAEKYAGKGPAYFGLNETDDSFEMKFTNDLSTLGDDMKISIVAPENETFDLMASKNYGKELSYKNPNTIRKYLSELLDCL